MSKVQKIFQEEKNHKTCAKKIVFLVPIWRFQHFRHLLQNPKLKRMANCFSYHSLDLYFTKSRGPSNSQNFRVHNFFFFFIDCHTYASSFFQLNIHQNTPKRALFQKKCKFGVTYSITKIPHTGDTESVNLCGQQHHYHEEKKNLTRGSRKKKEQKRLKKNLRGLK